MAAKFILEGTCTKYIIYIYYLHEAQTEKYLQKLLPLLFSVVQQKKRKNHVRNIANEFNLNY